MISGNLQATEQLFLERFGADDFIKKPFGRGEGFARIQHLSRTVWRVVRDRSADIVLLVEPQLSAAEHDATPEIALPDPKYQRSQGQNPC